MSTKDNEEVAQLVQNGNQSNGKMVTICKNMDAETRVLDGQASESQKQQKPLGERRKAVLRQQLMVIMGNSGVIGSGMIVAMPSVTLAQLTSPTEPLTLDTDEASWYSSINSLACPLGALIVSYLMDRIGRKYTIFITNVIGVLGWLLMATAYQHTDRNWIYWQMLMGRALGGITIGLFVSPAGAYSAEISLPKIRGQLIMTTSISLAVGILLMYILGYFIRSDIVLISTISGALQLISTLLTLLMPESPSWLMQKRRDERARKSLKYFRGLKRKDGDYILEFEKELTQIKTIAEYSRSASQNESFWQAVKLPEVYKPLLIMSALFGFQQWAGVLVIIAYAVQIATNSGVAIDPIAVAIMVGVARIVTSFFVSTAFEKFGRRPAGMFSAAGMGVSMLLLAAGGWFPDTIGTAAWLPIVCIVLHIVFSTMGLLTLPFLMISEVFPQHARGAASGITVFLGMIISFVVIKLYPSMDIALGTSNLFAFYALVSFAAVLFIFCLIPETRGRTLAEIEEYFRSGARLGDECVKGAQRVNNLKDVELNELFLKK